MENDKRIYKWDNVKLFLIFLVIFGHILDREASPSRLMETINFWIYSFHMPAFIFVSGLFSKHAIKQRKYLRLLSFVWLYLLAKLLITLANFAFANKMNFDLLNETGVPWYLLSLASFYLITIFLQRVQPKIMLPIIIVIGCASGYLPVEGFLSLGRTLGFFPFFYCGYLMDIQKLQTFLDHRKVKWAAIGVILSSFLFVNSQWSLATKFWGFLTGWASYAEISPAFEYSSFIQLFFYVAAALVSLSWFALLPKRKLPLSALGKDTLYPYLLHMPLIILLESGLQLDTLFIEWFTFRILALFFLALFILAITNMPVVKRGSGYLFNPIAYVLPKQWLKVK